MPANITTAAALHMATVGPKGVEPYNLRFGGRDRGGGGVEGEEGGGKVSHVSSSSSSSSNKRERRSSLTSTTPTTTGHASLPLLTNIFL